MLHLQEYGFRLMMLMLENPDVMSGKTFEHIFGIHLLHINQWQGTVCGGYRHCVRTPFTGLPHVIRPKIPTFP